MQFFACISDGNTMYGVFFVLLAVHAVILTTGYSEDKMKCKVDIAFVVDSTVSISEKNFGVMKGFIKGVVRSFDVGPEDVKFAAVSYSEQVKDEFFFVDHSDENDTIDAVDKIHHSEGKATRTYIAIARMREQLFGPGKGSRDDAVHVGIIITDGVTNPGMNDKLSETEGKGKTQKEAKLARDEGIYLFAVGIGSLVDKDELKGIASVDPDNKFMITVDGYDKLIMHKEDVKEVLSDKACHR